MNGAARTLRILMIDPYGSAAARGNSVSSDRIERGLAAAGHVVVRIPASGATVTSLRRLAARERFDVIHAIHAFRAGGIAREVAVRAGVPLVVSFRGTDADQGLSHPCLRPLVATALGAARVVTTQTDDQAERVRAAFPCLAAPIRIVPNGVDVAGASGEAVRASLGASTDAVIVTHVAGIRREKGFPECWDAVDAARVRCPDMRYVHAGPVIDAALAESADRWFAARAWARRLGAVTRARALDVVAASDVTLHASRVEGLSNALLESMALGVPAVARDIPATRFVMTDGREGRVFRDDADLAGVLAQVLLDPAGRRSMSAAARLGAARFSVTAERDGYVAAYRAAIR